MRNATSIPLASLQWRIILRAFLELRKIMIIQPIERSTVSDLPLNLVQGCKQAWVVFHGPESKRWRQQDAHPMQ